MRSMTGFGRGTAKSDGVSASVELRGVNQRFLRLGVRLPPELAALEPRVRELVSAGARRGQVDATVTVEGGASCGLPLPDPERVRRYVEAWRAVARKLGLSGEVDVGTLAAMPLVFTCDETGGLAERAWPAVQSAGRKALKAFNRMRETEGGRLCRDLRTHLAAIEDAAGSIASRAGRAKVDFARKLQERIVSLLDAIGCAGDQGATGAVSRANLEREIVLFADRSDVSEELERIASHVEQFRSTLSGGSPAGRKLEFLVQELQREITTLGSKVADVEAGLEVVEFKAELETIREQVQNIE